MNIIELLKKHKRRILWSLLMMPLGWSIGLLLMFPDIQQVLPIQMFPVMIVLISCVGGIIIDNISSFFEKGSMKFYVVIAIIVLVFLNLLGLAAFGSFKFLDQTKQINKVDKEITRLQPLVLEVKKTKERIRQVEEFLGLVAKMKGNPDLFAFMEKLTLELPEGSYLNQLRFTASNRTVVINGFTDNVGDLTEKLQAVGESRLQSTSRRKNMTYFQVETSLP